MQRKSAADEVFMVRALALARRGEGHTRPNPPVGAVVVSDGKIIGEGWHRRCGGDHAEVAALKDTLRRGNSPKGASVYVTLEPCPMCAGALVNARVEKVVYGASDIRFGALGSLFNLSELRVNHKLTVEGGILGGECRNLLSDYFKAKRKSKKSESDELS